MNTPRKHAPSSARSIKVTVPVDVADYFERQAQRYSTSLSAAASPVLCAHARGEISTGFTVLPSVDLRPR